MMKITRKAILIAMAVLAVGCSKNDDTPIPNPDNTDPDPKPENKPPSSFTLLKIEDNGTDISPFPVFTWNTANDPDGDSVTYDLLLGTDSTDMQTAATDLKTATFNRQSRLSLLTEYFWNVAAKDDKNGRTESEVRSFTTRNLVPPASPETASAAFSRRSDFATAVFKNKLWVIGGRVGSEDKNDVWSSEDGVNWVEVSDDAQIPWPARRNHQVLAFEDQLYLIAGRTDGGINFNDVWKSHDGLNWVPIIDKADFSPRRYHQALIFQDKMWIIGGRDGIDGTRKNDVWSSEDGLVWNPETQAAPFTGRHSHAALAFKDKIWVIGGFDNNQEYKNDIWSSTDGKNWVRETPNTEFLPRYGHQTVAYDGRIWLFGGIDLGGDKQNDIWYSTDGIEWINLIERAAFEPRHRHGLKVFDDRIWLIGGSGVVESEKDVWAFD